MVKYLECKELEPVDLALKAGVLVKDFLVRGRLEAHSCKLSGDDKRVVGSLERQWDIERVHSVERRISLDSYEQENGMVVLPRVTSGESVQSVQSVQSFGSFGASASAPAIQHSSPLGSFDEPSTRRLLANLILTLNHSFADYDFSSLKSEDFTREASVDMVVNSVNSRLTTLEDCEPDVFCQNLWKAIDSVICLEETEIFSYLPDLEADVFSSGKLWSVNYFFYNKRQKKIIFFALWVKSNLEEADYSSDSDVMSLPEDGGAMDDTMDME